MALGHEKQLQSFMRDWGWEDTTAPQLVPAVFPVVVLDQADEFLCRYRPTFLARATREAVAAVYSYIGLQAGAWPIVLSHLTPYGALVVGGLQLIFTVADPRTANQAELNTVTGLARGEAQSAAILAGTSAVAGNGWVLDDAAAVYEPEYRQQKLCLRPGEGIWIVSGAVNTTIFGMFSWTEFAIVPQQNPPDLVG